MSSVTKVPDAIVVGGGVIGTTLAYELQKRDAQTLLLEQGQIGREATWATAGIIGPPTAVDLPPHRAKLAEISQKRFAGLFDSIAEDTHLESSYLKTGKVLVAFTEAEVEQTQSLITWQLNHGFDARWMDPEEVRDAEPTIPDGVLGAYHTMDGGALTGHRFTESVADAFRQAGGEIREYTAATRVIVEGDRVTGVETPTGSFYANTVVLAAGAWTSFLGPSLRQSIPVAPVKGQMIGVTPASDGSRPRHVTGTVSGGYIVPRIDGTVAVGASLEHNGFDKRVTARAFEHAIRLMTIASPGLLDAQFTSAWAGLRPGTADDTPIMGPVPGYEGLWVSTGHFRTGIQLAPGSAVLMAEAIKSGSPDDLLKEFSLARFS
jgi:glycine oxidase